MSNYRRARIAGSLYFFTVVTHKRDPWLTSPAAMSRLRQAFRKVMRAHPFAMDAVVVLPDHLHAIWQLPEGDSDYSGRWRLIKHHVSVSRGQNWRWQPRYWEHLLRDEEDWRRHIEYIHYNPVKHGYVHAPRDWPFSSFRRSAKRGWHEKTWGTQEPPDLPTTTGE